MDWMTYRVCAVMGYIERTIDREEPEWLRLLAWEFVFRSMLRPEKTE